MKTLYAFIQSIQSTMPLQTLLVTWDFFFLGDIIYSILFLFVFSSKVLCCISAFLFTVFVQQSGIWHVKDGICRTTVWIGTGLSIQFHNSTDARIQFFKDVICFDLWPPSKGQTGERKKKCNNLTGFLYNLGSK